MIEVMQIKESYVHVASAASRVRSCFFSVTSAILHEICLILMDYCVFVVETDYTTPDLLPEETVF